MIQFSISTEGTSSPHLHEVTTPHLDQRKFGSCILEQAVGLTGSHALAALPSALDKNNLRLLIVRQGSLRLQQSDHDTTYGPNTIILVRHTDQGNITFIDGGSKIISITLPTVKIASSIINLHRLAQHSRVIPKESVNLLGHFASTMIKLDEATAVDFADLVDRHIGELVLSALSDAENNIGRSYRYDLNSQRKRDIKRDIAARIAEQALSAEDVAERVGISSRHLRSLLQEEGTSFTDILRYLRLQQACVLLSDPHLAALNIRSILQQVGFDKLSHFCHVFSRQYGMAPSKFRNQAMQQLNHRKFVRRATGPFLTPGQDNLPQSKGFNDLRRS